MNRATPESKPIKEFGHGAICLTGWSGLVKPDDIIIIYIYILYIDSEINLDIKEAHFIYINTDVNFLL